MPGAQKSTDGQMAVRLYFGAAGSAGRMARITANRKPLLIEGFVAGATAGSFVL
jgi:hypothetical protein